MALDPIKIPQNVYIEDRIVGPITLRQIIVVGIGGGISYSIWGLMSQLNNGGVPLPLTIIAWIPAVIAAAFAFVKVNDLSLIRICLLMLENMNKPSIRTFSPRQGISIHIRTFSEPQKDTHPIASKQNDVTRMDDLSSVLDRPLQRKAPGEAMAEQSQEEENPNVNQRPVQKDRIQASPLPAPSGTPSVSIFRDIVAH